MSSSSPIHSGGIFASASIVERRKETSRARVREVGRKAKLFFDFLIEIVFWRQLLINPANNLEQAYQGCIGNIKLISLIGLAISRPSAGISIAKLTE